MDLCLHIRGDAGSKGMWNTSQSHSSCSQPLVPNSGTMLVLEVLVCALSVWQLHDRHITAAAGASAGGGAAIGFLGKTR